MDPLCIQLDFFFSGTLYFPESMTLPFQTNKQIKGIKKKMMNFIMEEIFVLYKGEKLSPSVPKIGPQGCRS